MLQQDKNRLSLENIEKVLCQIEQNLSLHRDSTNKVTGEEVYELTKALFFSVPISPNQAEWTDEYKGEIFEKQYLGCSKRNFIANMNARLKRAARYRAREKELKRKGGIF